ncbi:hypothetical protein [Terrimonas alba]|uniref:hypothetical protein n=1 Tax=Terrimonas alba TaxID=3349636 RepID=UPI0035F40199
MLEQISELVKQFGQDAVVNNPDVPNEVNNAVLAEATNTITGGMQNMLAGGGLQDVISMFTGGRGVTQPSTQGGMAGLLKNPMVVMMIGHLISKLVSKFNMSPSQASNISNNLIPNVLNGLITRTNSNNPADDSFDFNDLIGSLTGGNTPTAESGGGFNFQGLLEQLAKSSGNGGFNLQDIVNQVTRGAQQNQVQQARSGRGFAELIKGFFS